MRRIILLLWIFGCFLVFLVPLQDMHNGEAHILFALLMIVLTFPLGYVLVTAIAFAGFLLDRHLGVSLPGNEVMLIPLWLAFLVVGYYQWFILMPKLWSLVHGKNAT